MKQKDQKEFIYGVMLNSFTKTLYVLKNKQVSTFLSENLILVKSCSREIFGQKCDIIHLFLLTQIDLDIGTTNMLMPQASGVVFMYWIHKYQQSNKCTRNVVYVAIINGSDNLILWKQDVMAQNFYQFTRVTFQEISHLPVFNLKLS